MTGPCGSEAAGTTGIGRALGSDVISNDIVMITSLSETIKVKPRTYNHVKISQLVLINPVVR